MFEDKKRVCLFLVGFFRWNQLMEEMIGICEN